MNKEVDVGPRHRRPVPTQSAPLAWSRLPPGPTLPCGTLAPGSRSLHLVSEPPGGQQLLALGGSGCSPLGTWGQAGSGPSLLPREGGSVGATVLLGLGGPGGPVAPSVTAALGCLVFGGQPPGRTRGRASPRGEVLHLSPGCETKWPGQRRSQLSGCCRGLASGSSFSPRLMAARSRGLSPRYRASGCVTPCNGVPCGRLAATGCCLWKAPPSFARPVPHPAPAAASCWTD